MKRLETKGEIERVVRIDSFFDWAYPLAYLILVAVVVYLYFGRHSSLAFRSPADFEAAAARPISLESCDFVSINPG